TALVLMMGLWLISCREHEAKTNGVSSMQLPKDSSLFTKITWLDSTTRDFGSIPEGQKLEVTYRFLNSGNKPLIIARVQPSCGCTVAEQPDEPIMPGKEGVIKASFNSEGRIGINHKKIYVYANTLGSQSNEIEFNVLVQKKKW
ncbi:MAG TPA: DUF1573 domain-containing protein, partial [Puia sp.]|nr:DUF1573 domain-containing protein [Puia sp.]